jgi:hypothetical protein
MIQRAIVFFLFSPNNVVVSTWFACSYYAREQSSKEKQRVWMSLSPYTGVFIRQFLLLLLNRQIECHPKRPVSQSW